MKLRNKKTGDIYELNEFCLYDDKGFAKRPFLKSLAELNEEWEDYEGPKDHWEINTFGDVERVRTIFTEEMIDELREIGNYFETREEAEQAVEKLKAWKRLKNKGFRFSGVTPMEYFIRFTYDKPRQILDNQQHPEVAQQFNKDLDLLFGGEE